MTFSLTAENVLVGMKTLSGLILLNVAYSVFLEHCITIFMIMVMVITINKTFYNIK